MKKSGAQTVDEYDDEDFSPRHTEEMEKIEAQDEIEVILPV